MFALISLPHPLTKFEKYVDKKGAVNDYVKRFGIVKGLINYFNCRIKRGGLVSVYYSRVEKRCTLRSGSADVMVFEQVFLFDDYKIGIKMQPQFIIDAGAHIGLASLYFSMQYPGAQIICLEPQPDNFNLLKHNTNKFPQIIPLNCALWHYSGKIYLENPDANTWAFRVSEQKSAIAVATVDVKSILDQYGQTKVNLLKIDIEGSEKALFENRPTWTGHVDYLVIETHDHIHPGAAQAVEKALCENMRLIKRQGENLVYQRCGLNDENASIKNG